MARRILLSICAVLLIALASVHSFAAEKGVAVSPAQQIKQQADALKTSCIAKEAIKSLPQVSDKYCQCMCGQYACTSCIMCPYVRDGKSGLMRFGEDRLLLKEMLR